MDEVAQRRKDSDAPTFEVEDSEPTRIAVDAGVVINEV